MLIHTDYTPQPGHYNENVSWGVRDKLDVSLNIFIILNTWYNFICAFRLYYICLKTL